MNNPAQSSLSFFPAPPQKPIKYEIHLIMDKFSELNPEEQEKVFRQIHSEEYTDIKALFTFFAEILTKHLQELARLNGVTFKDYVTDHIVLTLRLIRIRRYLQKKLHQRPDASFALDGPIVE